MDIKVFKVKQYNSTYKHLLIVDGVPVVVSQSKNRISAIVAYLGGNEQIIIHDGAVKRRLDKIINKEQQSKIIKKEQEIIKEGIHEDYWRTRYHGVY